jgi:hypothetical protein
MVQLRTGVLSRRRQPPWPFEVAHADACALSGRETQGLEARSLELV